MKKILLIITILCLCGCGKKVENKTMDIILNGNPTTGYEWVCKVGNESIIKIKSNDYISNKDNGLAGVGGVYKFTLEGLKEGVSQFNCEYKRSWENEDAYYTSNYNIKVDENKELSIINRSGNYEDEIDVNNIVPYGTSKTSD